jgi:alcohol dehydrogenase class IV
MLVVKTGTNFEWQMSARVVFGLGTIDSIADRAKTLAMSKPMIVTDKNIADTDGFKGAIENLKTGGLTPLIWAEVQSDPPDTSIAAGAKAYIDDKCDGLIGFGGGSSMDSARGIGCVAVNGHRINDYALANPDRLPIKDMPPLICIPTTAGTAAEVTNICVITDTTKHVKFFCFDPMLYAKIALLDPALTFSLPKGVTASTGMDALCHAVDGYLSNMENPISDPLLMYATELVAKNLRRAVYVPNDVEARTNMLLGSLIAGIGFGSSFPSATHAVGHAFGAVFHIPHGLACTLCLPECLELIRPSKIEKMATLAEIFGVNTAGMSKEEASKAAVKAIEELMVDVDIPTLSQATGGMSDADVKKVAEIAMTDPNTGNASKIITEEMYINEVLKKALAK